MSRLTQRVKDGTPYIDCGEMCADWHKCDKYECKKNIILENLAHYEDLAEQGRLVELPVPIGTPIYFLCEGFDCETYEDDFTIEEATFDLQWFDDFGKSAFLTWEEAEKTLEKITKFQKNSEKEVEE